MYVRLRDEVHEEVAKIAQQRGYPHTITSVAAELISRGLQTKEKSHEAR